MRIIGGTLKGRRFYPPAGKWPTRPTTDFAKEGLFNILDNRIEYHQLQALDLFGGTGNHSFELVSRGCPSVTYVDNYYSCIRFVLKMAKEWQVETFIHIVKSDVRKFLKHCTEQFDYVFAGPPYALKWLDEIPDLLFDNKLISKSGLFVLEHNPNSNFETHRNFSELRVYGKTYFSFFKQS